MSTGELPSTSFDAAAAHIGTGVALTGSGTAVICGFTVNEWGVIVGIVTAVLGLVVQVWFKWREDQRRERYFAQKAADDEMVRESVR